MLPKEKTKIKDRIEDQTILIYGQPKIGKSTLASQFDNPLFLATEAGLNHLEVYQVPIKSWDEFLKAAAEVAAGDHHFKTIIIDTVDNLLKFCADYVLKKAGVAHESDLGYGKGWQLVGNEFLRALTKLSLLSYGLVLVSHAQTKEIQTRTGNISKAEPTLSGGARKVVLGMADVILYCESAKLPDKDGKLVDRRIMRTKSTENWEAGDRTGRLPAEMPLDINELKKHFGGKK